MYIASTTFSLYLLKCKLYTITILDTTIKAMVKGKKSQLIQKYYKQIVANKEFAILYIIIHPKKKICK